MKLKQKILLFSSIFMFVLIVSVNISIYFFFYKTSTNTELEELNLVATNVVSALKENPDVHISGLLEAYLPPNGMIRVIRSNNVPMFEITRSSEYLTLPWEYKNTESMEIISRENSANIAVIEKPIIWPAGELRGKVVTLQISNQLISLHETMRTLLYILVILSFVILIPVILASSLLSRFLLRPIQNLIETMKENSKQGQWQKMDISKRSKDEIYEMEKTFNEMIDHLKENYEKQEMFVSDASHELKTPVQIIKSYAQLLDRRKNLDEEVFKEAVHAIDSETDRIKTLIEQLLSLAKNKHALKKEKINLMKIVQNTMTTFQQAYDREIFLHSGEKEFFVQGNNDQLKQVVYILLDNAIKYSKKPIHVNMFKHDGYIFFQVKDEGQGIPKEEVNHIFDRFYRVDKARSRATGGSGLGLAIAKSITEDHAGELTVESEQGKGSTFTLKMKITN